MSDRIRLGGAERLACEDTGARPDVAVAVEDPERDVVAVEPLVVVDRGPVEEAPDVDPAPDRGVNDVEPALPWRPTQARR